MANRFWMSVRQAILNTSGFFSITSLEHKAYEVRAAPAGQDCMQPGTLGAQRKDWEGRRVFVHCKSLTTKLQENRQFPAASHEQHPAPRRVQEGCSSPQG